MRDHSLRGGFRRAWPFLLPSMAGFVLFSLWPVIISFLLSLTGWNGLSRIDLFGGLLRVFREEFAGVANYRDILAGEEFWQVLRNTLYFIVLYVPLMIAASLGVASILQSTRRGVTAFRILYYIPVLTSWVAGALIWKWVLSPEYGILNGLLGLVGITGPGWLQDETWAMPGIVLASVWKDAGFFGLILLSGLQGVNPSYYEAASLDGAGPVRRFLRITLPLISPVLFFVVVISIINSFQLFPQVMVMTKDAGPNGATRVMVERIYTYGFKYFKMGYASAFSWLLFVIILIMTFLQIKGQKRWVHYES